MELAAAKLAISTLSPIISKLGCYVYDSYFGGDVTAEEMKKLTNVLLPTIREVIGQTELVPSVHLMPWLEDLQDAAFEAEDFIDLYEYKKIKHQVSSLPESVYKFKNKTKETLRFILPKSSFKRSFEKLQKSADEAAVKLLPLIKSAHKTAIIQHKYKIPQASTSTVSSLSCPLFGRDKECNNIIEMLQVNESRAHSTGGVEKIPVIAIQGIGGSGKTSTAQGVYNDKRVEIFDLKMWVHVSRSFDVRRLTREIIESANKGACPRVDNLDVLQTKLKGSLSKAKKFLLVLDDIWCEDKMQWDQLVSPLNEVKRNGSKIIITTRMERVASILQVDQVIFLEELKMEDCWSILKHYAFGNSETAIEDKELEIIGNQIISKVKYCPLALRIVGSSLYKRISVNDWEIILRQDILKEIMGVLLLSFQHLPSHLQRCFAYCSLFPKDFKFYMHHEALISLWIAQGFVENTSENELTLEEIGRIYIEELLSYSFFEIVKPGGFDYFNSYYRMHDLLHDLAQKVSKRYIHRIEEDSLSIPATCIHLSMRWMGNLKKVDIDDMLKLKNLRTLAILKDYKYSNTYQNRNVNFPSPTKLRVLFIDNYLQMEVVSNLHIDRLKHLRYLNLKYDGELNRSLLAKLYHLQILYCFRWPVNKEYPRYGLYYSHGVQANDFVQGLENLINLRTLKMDSCGYHPKLDIRKLTSLQNLAVFHPKKHGKNEMMPLKNLNLHGSLTITNLENIRSKGEAAEAMLNKKKNLKDLIFEWSNPLKSTDGLKSCEDVLEGLEPHPNLEGICIVSYQGAKAPNWMKNDNRLPCLVKLHLYKCENLTEVPYLPPCLKVLCVEKCNNLMQLPPIGDTLDALDLRDCSKLMPPSMSNNSLRLLDDLTIIRCPRNEGRLFNELPFLTNLQYLKLGGFSNIQNIPYLNPTLIALKIIDFPKLTSLGNLQHCTSLISLGIKKSPMLMTDAHLLLGKLPCSIKWLKLCGSGMPLMPLFEENLHHISSLEHLSLECFKSKTLPSLEKLSSLEELIIKDCPGVVLLPNLPISLLYLMVEDCPKLKAKYEEGGQLHKTISHIHEQYFF